MSSGEWPKILKERKLNTITLVGIEKIDQKGPRAHSTRFSFLFLMTNEIRQQLSRLLLLKIEYVFPYKINAIQTKRGLNKA